MAVEERKQKRETQKREREGTRRGEINREKREKGECYKYYL